MKLIFIHGWGLDAHLWDDVCALLSEFDCKKIDLGFYESSPPLAGGVRGGGDQQHPPSPVILIGHSLGFIYGLKNYRNWRGWIAINSFARFIKTENAHGCATAPELRDITLRLRKDPEKALQDFHDFIGAQSPVGEIDLRALHDGLNILRDTDVSAAAAALPGLVVASTHDPLVPVETSKDLATGKDILWHQTGGHVLPQSDAVFCANAIRSFIGKHDFNRT